MNVIKKSSFTLVELSITMIVGAVLVLALASQFMIMSRFKAALENKADPSLEAYIVLNHMAHVLRFAKTTPVPGFSSNKLTADIEGGHIALIPLTTTPPALPNSTTCYYRWDPNTNCLYFRVGAGAEQKLSEYVTYFDANITGVAPNYEITLKLIFSRGNTVTPVQTKIKVLGE